jgi:uncharacterized Fe-S cluster-containing protein
VHLVGPVHLLQGLPAPEDIGICMVAAFEGTVIRGENVGGWRYGAIYARILHDTKEHSEVVVHLEGTSVRIEGAIWKHGRF